MSAKAFNEDELLYDTFHPIEELEPVAGGEPLQGRPPAGVEQDRAVGAALRVAAAGALGPRTPGCLDAADEDQRRVARLGQVGDLLAGPELDGVEAHG